MTAAVSPTLAAVDTILNAVAVGDLSPTDAVAELRSRGFTPCREALEDGVRALLHRDDFLARLGNPYSYLDVEPRAGVTVWDAAVERAENDYWHAVNLLSRRPVRLAVTG